MVPRACGSCWAFATISALSDRIRIARFKKTGKLDTEVLLSPQVLLDCGMRSFGSCHGGDPRYAHKWIHENGIVDLTCNPYIASHPSWMGAGDCAATQCHTCNLKGECFVLEDPVKYRISEYGTLNFTTSEEFQLQAMNEIYHRGPIVVSMYSLSPEYRQFKGGYILRDSTKYPGTTHVVSLVGWGTDAETGVKYWVVRNSDGTNWGDRGFFLAERGVNIYNMESHGAWAVPIVRQLPLLERLERHLRGPPSEHQHRPPNRRRLALGVGRQLGAHECGGCWLAAGGGAEARGPWGLRGAGAPRLQRAIRQSTAEDRHGGHHLHSSATRTGVGAAGAAPAAGDDGGGRGLRVRDPCGCDGSLGGAHGLCHGRRHCAGAGGVLEGELEAQLGRGGSGEADGGHR
ncbi:hypothetical protein ON010_g18720 [Phytophthora cinnamomi]|nr:hypothetical protein ON010_g18720 [Phytophthora cinnamomi]